MSDRAKAAKELFKSGYNCAQAVLIAFCEDAGIEKDTAARLASSFGGGMGRMREVCGAVSGMFMAAGLIYGYSSPESTEKGAHYALIQQLASEFKQKNGSIICRELLSLQKEAQSPEPEERTPAYYKKRPCAELVSDAAEILEAYIRSSK